MRRWSRPCGPSPSSAASTRPGWRWSRSAGRARCTRARSRTPSGCAPSSFRPVPACCRRSGLLASPRQVDLVRSWPGPALGHGGRRRADGVGRRGRRCGRGPGGRTCEVALDCRYAGQGHELHRRRRSTAFADEHERRNGYRAAGRRRSRWSPCAARARRSAARRAVDLPTGAPRPLVGPAVVAEPDCTVWIPRVDGRAGAPERRVGDHAVSRRPRPRCRSCSSASPAIADEMGAVLRRAAFSPNIKERADCSAALFTACRRAARAGRAHPRAPRVDAGVGRGGDRCLPRPRPGEQVVLNDPFAGGTHLNDITVVAPCVVDGRLVGLGRQPRPPRRRRRHGAGLDASRRGRDRRRRACESRRCARRRTSSPSSVANSRTRTSGAATSTPRAGANRVGVARLAELVGRRVPALDEVLDYGERRMRAALAELRTGRGRSTTCSTRAGPGRQQRRRASRCALTIAATRSTFDFTGTGSSAAGNVNAVEAVTVSAVAWAHPHR